MQSGFSLPWNMQVTKDQAQTRANNLKSFFNCSSLSCLRSLSASDIISYQTSNTSDVFWPTLDGYYLNASAFDLYNNGSYKKVNILAGVNRNEMTAFTCFVLPNDITVLQQKAVFASYFGIPKMTSFYPLLPNYYTLANYSNNLAYVNEILSNSNVQCNARYATSLMSSQIYNSYFYTYDYHFSWVSSCYGTAHAAELPIQFPSLLKTRSSTQYYSFNDNETLLSKQMITYWSNFVVSGNPNKNSTGVNLLANQTTWPRYSTCNDTQLYIQLQGGSVENTMYSKVCPFWSTYTELPVLQCNTSLIPPIPQDSTVTPQVSTYTSVTKNTTAVTSTGGVKNGTSVATSYATTVPHSSYTIVFVMVMLFIVNLVLY